MKKNQLKIDPNLLELKINSSFKERNIERIDELLLLLSSFWKQNPDLRLGQIIENIAIELKIPSFYLEDSKIIDWFKNKGNL